MNPQTQRNAQLPKGSRLPNPEITLQEALRAAVEASQFLIGVSHDPSRALAIIEPYAEFEGLTGGSAEQVRCSRSIVCSVVADCHKALGDYRTSANWYRRASGYLKRGGFPSEYAELVVNHELADHYENALECMRVNRDWWRSQPLLVRLHGHLVSRWWLYPSGWKMRFRERSLISELESLIAERNVER